MSYKFSEIISIIENLKIPAPDTTKINLAGKEIAILESRFVGTMLDDMLRKKIESLNSQNNFLIEENSIFRFTELDNKEKYELTFDNIHKDLIRKYNSNRYKNEIDSDIVFNTAKYLTKILVEINFNQFIAEDILIANAKLGYPNSVKDNFGRLRAGTSFKPDLIIDDLLLEIKTFDRIIFNNNMFVQLFLYYIRFNHVFSKTNSVISKGAKITKYRKTFQTKRLGIFYSKHNYLWTFNILDLCSHKEIDILNDFCASNIKQNNIDFPSEIESLFNLLRSRKIVFRTNNNKGDTYNLLKSNKLNQIKECIILRKSCKDSQKLEIISEMIIKLNNEYCYSQYDFRYRINHRLNYKRELIVKYDEHGNSYYEKALKHEGQFIDYYEAENILVNDNKYLTNSIEDFLFFINHINKLHKRISLLENLKYSKLLKFVKLELDIVEQHVNEKLYSKS